jgi:hypothetical protein
MKSGEDPTLEMENIIFWIVTRCISEDMLPPSSESKSNSNTKPLEARGKLGLFISSLVSFSILKMETILSSETSGSLSSVRSSNR